MLRSQIQEHLLITHIMNLNNCGKFLRVYVQITFHFELVFAIRHAKKRLTTQICIQHLKFNKFNTEIAQICPSHNLPFSRCLQHFPIDIQSKIHMVILNSSFSWLIHQQNRQALSESSDLSPFAPAPSQMKVSLFYVWIALIASQLVCLLLIPFNLCPPLNSQDVSLGLPWWFRW